MLIIFNVKTLSYKEFGDAKLQTKEFDDNTFTPMLFAFIKAPRPLD